MLRKEKLSKGGRRWGLPSAKGGSLTWRSPVSCVIRPGVNFTVRRLPSRSIIRHEEYTKNWLDDHPLTQADLEQEAELLKAIDHRLKFD
jgi:hypothetical protein